MSTRKWKKGDRIYIFGEFLWVMKKTQFAKFSATSCVKKLIFAYSNPVVLFSLLLAICFFSISLVCVHCNVPGARQPWVYRFSQRTPQESNAGF